MRIFEDRQHERRIGAIRRRVVTVRPFHPPPSVVLAARAARRLQVDLFPRILSDVADPEIAGVTIETESPRIAHTVRPDLAARAADIDEWIRRRNSVRRDVDVDPKNLAEEHGEILSVVVRVAAGASVADT